MTFIIGLFKFMLNVIYLFFKLFKTRNQITLISRESNTIPVDFKLLGEELSNSLPDYKIVYLCKKMDNKVAYAFHMLRQMYHISRSKIVILDTYCITISNLKHKENLKVIQIWHALGLMKKAGYASMDKKEGRSSKVAKALNMHRGYTKVYTTSKACRKPLSEVFDCPKEIVENVPLPRIDLLKNEEIIEQNKYQILQSYPVFGKKENVLYVPTYRNDESELSLYINDMIENFDFEKYNLIVKLHPLSKVIIDNTKVFTCRQYSSSELISISDYVISDYSSIIYEAGIQKKNLLFYAFDLDDYDDGRGFFIDYKKEVPGPICLNGKDVIKSIKKYPKKKYDSYKFTNKYVDLSIDNYTKNMAKKIIELLK